MRPETSILGVEAPIVGEPAPPRSELFASDAVLLLQIANDVALLLVDPARVERNSIELEPVVREVERQVAALRTDLGNVCL